MKISFLPAGDHTTASSRIRIYSVQAALAARGVECRNQYWPDADVLLAQKRVTREILAQALAFKAKGGRVVYDCDDLGRALHDWAPAALFKQMLALADVVTTNSTMFQNILLSDFGVKRVAIVPDVVDYYLTAPVSRPVRSGENLRVLWFGNRGNLHLVVKYLRRFLAIPRCELVICTDPNAHLSVFSTPPCAFEPWSIERFPEILSSCDLTFLPHDGRLEDRAKSSNRMITSIAWGVPAIISHTPEYRRTADLIHFPECVVTAPDALPAVVEAMRPAEVRTRYLAQAQAVVWRDHSPDAVADRLLRLCGELLGLLPSADAESAAEPIRSPFVA